MAVPPRGPGGGPGALVLLLADSRLPMGGHVHSAGLEQARADGRLRDIDDLERLLLRRLRTAGLVAAAIAASACQAPHRHAALDGEVDARTPSPDQREASRAQGRGLLRLAATTWPAPTADLTWSALGPRPHHAVALGCVAHAGGLAPGDAAAVTAYLSVSGPATAAQRLLALDPVAVAALSVRLSAAVDDVVATVPDDLADLAALPARSDPLADLLAGRHATAGDRLFAS